MAPYLQQHHIHCPVHLGDVTQAVAPLVPLIHFCSNCTPPSPEFQMSHAELQICAFQTPLSIKPSKGPKLIKKKLSGIQFLERMEDFLATSEHRGDKFVIHNINSKCLLMFYFMQIPSEREVCSVSITGDNSSRKIKNEPATHNGRRTWGKNPKQAIKIQSALCQEKQKREKGKTTLFQRDGMKTLSFPH